MEGYIAKYAKYSKIEIMKQTSKKKKKYWSVLNLILASNFRMVANKVLLLLLFQSPALNDRWLMQFFFSRTEMIKKEGGKKKEEKKKRSQKRENRQKKTHRKQIKN